MRFIALGEPEYPPALRQIDAAPPLLALRGREEALQQPAVAIVGSRNASAAGLAFADRLARGLGAAGYVVVSGLARGIDLRAQSRRSETGTIAVLAGGHARPYPPEAAPLLPRIAEYGAVVSEMPIEWEPRGRDFPRRNRLVSGLALATVVVEAARGSGSLITARFAAEQGREVFAVPGSPLDPRAEGTNDLLREGATMCARVEDVLAASIPCARAISSVSWRSRVNGAAVAGRSRGRATNRPNAARRFDLGERGGRRADRSLAGTFADFGRRTVACRRDDEGRLVRMAMVELELAGRIEYSGGDRVALLTAPESDEQPAQRRKVLRRPSGWPGRTAKRLRSGRAVALGAPPSLCATASPRLGPSPGNRRADRGPPPRHRLHLRRHVGEIAGDRLPSWSPSAVFLPGHARDPSRRRAHGAMVDHCPPLLAKSPGEYSKRVLVRKLHVARSVILNRCSTRRHGERRPARRSSAP